MRSIQLGTSLLVAVCFGLPACSKEEPTPAKRGATVPHQNQKQKPGQGAPAGSRADENRPSAGNPAAAQGAGGADANRPHLKQGTGPGPGGAAKTPAAPWPEVFGTWGGRLTSGDDLMFAHLVLEKAASGAVRARLDVPALGLSDQEVAAQIDANRIRVEFQTALGRARLNVESTGGGKALIGSLALNEQPSGPRFSVDLRPIAADATAPSSATYRGTLTMPSRGDIAVSMVLTTMPPPKGDLLGAINAPDMATAPSALRQVKKVGSTLTAIWPLTTPASLQLEFAEDLSALTGSFKHLGQEMAIALTRVAAPAAAPPPAADGG